MKTCCNPILSCRQPGESFIWNNSGRLSIMVLCPSCRKHCEEHLADVTIQEPTADLLRQVSEQDRSTYEEARKAYDLLIDGFMSSGGDSEAHDHLVEELQEKTGWTPMQLAEEAKRQHAARVASPAATGTVGCRCHGGELRPHCVEECSVGRKLAVRSKVRTYPSGPFH